MDPVSDERLANFVVSSHRRSHPNQAENRQVRRCCLCHVIKTLRSDFPLTLSHKQCGSTPTMRIRG